MSCPLEGKIDAHHEDVSQHVPSKSGQTKKQSQQRSTSFNKNRKIPLTTCLSPPQKKTTRKKNTKNNNNNSKHVHKNPSRTSQMSKIPSQAPTRPSASASVGRILVNGKKPKECALPLLHQDPGLERGGLPKRVSSFREPRNRALGRAWASRNPVFEDIHSHTWLRSAWCRGLSNR